MVEADSHLKQLLTSVLDIYKVFEHIDMLSLGMRLWQYTVIPTLLGSDFGVLAHLWSQNNVITSRLRLISTSNCFILDIHKVFEHIDMLSMGKWQ